MEQELLQWLGDLIITWGGIAGGISAVTALGVKMTKPMRERKKRERDE